MVEWRRSREEREAEGVCIFGRSGVYDDDDDDGVFVDDWGELEARALSFVSVLPIYMLYIPSYRCTLYICNIFGSLIYLNKIYVQISTEIKTNLIRNILIWYIKHVFDELKYFIAESITEYWQLCTETPRMIRHWLHFC